MRLRNLLLLGVSTVLTVVGWAGSPVAPAGQEVPLPHGWGDGSLLFVENVGQFDPRARFQVYGGDGTLWLTDDGLWIALASPEGGGQGAILHLTFPHARRHPRLVPFGRQNVVVNYYRGNDPARWRTGVPVWSGVRYEDLYPGVDLVVGGRSDHLVWRLVNRAPAADLSVVRLRVEGATSLSVDGAYLRVGTAAGEVALPLLTLVGRSPGGLPAVIPTGSDGFEVVSPFARAALSPPPRSAQDVPQALRLGTYLGGGDRDWINSVAVDSDGAVYVTGATFSADFPTQGPGASSSLSGNCDAFVAKLEVSSDGIFRPLYSTYLGGSYDDPAGAYGNSTTESGLDIAVENGTAYVAGYTWSNDFPTTAGAYDTTFNGPAVSPDATPERPGWDGFVVKLDPSGNLAYSTYLGGSGYDVPGGERGGGDDEARSIAVRNGVIYVTGYTQSSDFPTTPGAYDRTYANVDIGLNDDVFVVKLAPTGNGEGDLLYGTFVGGGMPEVGNGIAVDGSGVVYVTGYTGDIFGPAIASDFPTTAGSYAPQSQADDVQAFFFRLNPAGNGNADLLYSTFLGGGDGSDYGDAIVVDGTGDVYIIGNTNASDFPTTEGAFDRTYNGGWADAFVAEMNPGGNGNADLRYATFLGGSGTDGLVGSRADIALIGEEEVYVAGYTSSSDFPVTSDAYDASSNSIDAFVARLRLQGRGQDDLVYSTYLGGSNADQGNGVALASGGDVWVVGSTHSSNFPTTDESFDRLYGGNGDGFVVKMAAPPRPDLSLSTKEVSPTRASAGQVVTFTVRLVNSGTVSATVTFTDTLPVALLLQGIPTASASPTPTVNGQTITWSGAVGAGSGVFITYTARLTSTTMLTPTAVNLAVIDDGRGNVYTRRAFVNPQRVYLPLVVRRYGP